METSKQLEQKLKETKLSEAKQELEKELQSLKSHYFDKCSSSHTIARYYNEGINLSMRWIKDVFIEEDNYKNGNEAGKIVMIVDTLRYSKNKNGQACFELKENEKHGRFGTYDFMFRHSISKAQFQSAAQQAKAQIDLIYDKIKVGLQSTDCINIGDDSSEESKVKHLLESKTPIIDLSKYQSALPHTTIQEMLGWYKHPFLIGKSYLLNTIYSKTIIEKMIANLIKSAQNWGGSIYERDMPRARALQAFIDTMIFT